MRQSRRARASTEAWARLPSWALQALSMAYTYKLLQTHDLIAIDRRSNVFKSALTPRINETVKKCPVLNFSDSKTILI